MENFEQFYNSTKRGFFQYILSKVNDTDIANDIVQESYLKIYKHYTNNFSVQLLYKIGKNLIYDEYNSEKNHVDISNIEISYAEENSSKIELEKVIELLDDEEKQLFFMSVVDGLKYDEISKLMGISVANIKVKIFRARKKINGALKGGAQ